jgi:hypothetical protein
MYARRSIGALLIVVSALTLGVMSGTASAKTISKGTHACDLSFAGLPGNAGIYRTGPEKGALHVNGVHFFFTCVPGHFSPREHTYTLRRQLDAVSGQFTKIGPRSWAQWFVSRGSKGRAGFDSLNLFTFIKGGYVLQQYDAPHLPHAALLKVNNPVLNGLTGTMNAGGDFS